MLKADGIHYVFQPESDTTRQIELFVPHEKLSKFGLMVCQLFEDQLPSLEPEDFDCMHSMSVQMREGLKAGFTPEASIQLAGIVRHARSHIQDIKDDSSALSWPGLCSGWAWTTFGKLTKLIAAYSALSIDHQHPDSMHPLLCRMAMEIANDSLRECLDAHAALRQMRLTSRIKMDPKTSDPLPSNEELMELLNGLGEPWELIKPVIEDLRIRLTSA